MKPMSVPLSIAFFGVPAVVFYAVTHTGIPAFVRATGGLPVIVWFVSGGLFVFVPLLILSIAAYWLEGRKPAWGDFSGRFRLRVMTSADWLWTFGAIAVISFLSGAVVGVLMLLHRVLPLGEFSLSPPFLDFKGLEDGQLWILLVWLPFFFFNIVGEEFLWRGYILPRQEARNGHSAWLVNAVLWAVFHACFGWRLIAVLLPILFILPYVVQRRGNTWIGICIHGVVNGASFLAIAFAHP